MPSSWLREGWVKQIPPTTSDAKIEIDNFPSRIERHMMQLDWLMVKRSGPGGGSAWLIRIPVSVR